MSVFLAWHNLKSLKISTKWTRHKQLFGKISKFSQKSIKIIRNSKKYRFLCINLEYFGIHTFCVFFNFLGKYFFPLSILFWMKELFFEVNYFLISQLVCENNYCSSSSMPPTSKHPASLLGFWQCVKIVPVTGSCK